MRDILTGALRASLVTLVLCGLAYPLALVGLGQWLLPGQANGSLVRGADGTVVGSRLIGQSWTGPQWFHGRPSANAYDGANSGATNFGPASRQLAERLDANRRALAESEPALRGARLPADMLTASGSGLDPDISPANAALQVARVARARGVPEADIAALVEKHIAGRSLGVFGEPCVNVLSLNIALQEAYPSRQ